MIFQKAVLVLVENRRVLNDRNRWYYSFEVRAEMDRNSARRHQSGGTADMVVLPIGQSLIV